MELIFMRESLASWYHGRWRNRWCDGGTFYSFRCIENMRLIIFDEARYKQYFFAIQTIFFYESESVWSIINWQLIWNQLFERYLLFNRLFLRDISYPETRFLFTRLPSILFLWNLRLQHSRFCFIALYLELFKHDRSEDFDDSIHRNIKRDTSVYNFNRDSTIRKLNDILRIKCAATISFFSHQQEKLDNNTYTDTMYMSQIF